jgi:DNA-binding response OmpR family regulator
MFQNVLVVEDYEDLRVALVMALRRAHYTCDVVENSADAVLKLREHQYGAVLLATRLPIADDPVVRYLLIEDAQHETKVIVMAEPDQQTDDYRSLMKPFNNDELVATLRS